MLENSEVSLAETETALWYSTPSNDGRGKRPPRSTVDFQISVTRCDYASYVALGVIFFLLVLITAAIVALGSLPGKIARKRGHPWPDAVNAASWIGMATGVFWPVAFIWAFLPIPQRSKEGSVDATPDTADVEGRIASLEAALDKLRSQSKEGAA